MTLPTNIILPDTTEFETDPKKYINELSTKLEDMYEDLSDNINGSFRNNSYVDSSQWIPTLSGLTIAGSFTYGEQIGWVLRQGIMTDVWGSITWTATTATGDLYLNLPYIVTKSAGQPFIGTCATSDITYLSGTSAMISAKPNTYQGLIHTYGSAATLSNLNVPASGRIDFHVRYIGVLDE